MECNAFENSGQNFLASYSRNKLNFLFPLMETKFSDDLQQADKLKKEYDESA
jgi:hypothetical protein